MLFKTQNNKEITNFVGNKLKFNFIIHLIK